MALVVDKIKCVEESDEVGSDDIYLIVFRGLTVPPFTSGLVSLGPGLLWADFDTGETHNQDLHLVQSSPDSVFAVMVVEKDNAVDVSGAQVLGAWRTQTDIVWKSTMLGFAASRISPSSATAKNAGFVAIQNALQGLASIYMNFPRGNDDPIDVKRVTIVSPGTSETIRFRSEFEDATYDVTFKQTAPA